MMTSISGSGSSISNTTSLSPLYITESSCSSESMAEREDPVQLPPELPQNSNDFVSHVAGFSREQSPGPKSSLPAVPTDVVLSSGRTSSSFDCNNAEDIQESDTFALSDENLFPSNTFVPANKPQPSRALTQNLLATGESVSSSSGLLAVTATNSQHSTSTDNVGFEANKQKATCLVDSGHSHALTLPCSDSTGLTCKAASSSVAKVTGHDKLEGYECDFVLPLEAKYQCPICLQCLRDPYQTNCGHLFCHSCIFRCLRNGTGECPQDRQQLTENNIFPDNHTKREVESLQISCPYKKYGCLATYELRENYEHTSACKFRVEQCPRGCGQNITKEQLDYHQKEECLHRIVSCRHCSAHVEFANMAAHEEDCPLMIIPCKYCSKQLSRQQQTRHQETDCQLVTVMCMYHTYGCDAMMQRQALSLHMQESTQHHMRMLLDAVSKIHEQLHALQTSDGGATQLPPIRTNPCFEKFSQACAKSDAKTVEGELENRSEEHEYVTELQKRVATLEQHNLELQSKVEAEKQRNELLEARCCNGEYVWKVRNFSAVKDVSHSPGFYTGMFGYKVCLRMNVNRQDGTISIFVHFMMGDYDDILNWPFTGKIHFVILDQSSEQHPEHIKATFDSDPKLEAFKRPVIKRNPKGFGFKDLTTIEHLQRRPYIKDNSLFIKVTVIPQLSCCT